MKALKNIAIIAIVTLTSIITVSCTHKKPISPKVETKTISVYFVKKVSPIKSELFPVNRNVSPGTDILNTAITQLLQGPSALEKKQGYYTEIPKKTVVLSIKETPQEDTINLSKDFESGGGSESMTKRIKQLENTALNNSDNKKVYLEISGKRAAYIGGEGVEITQPLSQSGK